MLKVTVCVFFWQNESVTGLLFQIKLAPQAVEEVLDRVAKVCVCVCVCVFVCMCVCVCVCACVCVVLLL